jgi:hypothetical protein
MIVRAAVVGNAATAKALRLSQAESGYAKWAKTL